MNKSLDGLLDYCKSQGFKGWDPYDGLNSKVFKGIGLYKVAFSDLHGYSFLSEIQLIFEDYFCTQRIQPKGYRFISFCL